MREFCGNPQSQSGARYNRALSTFQVRIEITFGVNKASWNCLRALRASQIITAMLHNIAKICKERAPHVPLVADNVMDPTTVDHPTGAAVRRAISNQFFGLFLFQSGSQLSSISFWMSRFTDMA